jgi:hypothetical protein
VRRLHEPSGDGATEMESQSMTLEHHKRWIGALVEAMENRGGNCHLSYIYEETKRMRKRDGHQIRPSHEETVRKMLQSYCKEAKITVKKGLIYFTWSKVVAGTGRSTRERSASGNVSARRRSKPFLICLRKTTTPAPSRRADSRSRWNAYINRDLVFFHPVSYGNRQQWKRPHLLLNIRSDGVCC